MTSTIYSGPKAKLCPHGVLGKSKCKRCNADKTNEQYRKYREANPLPPRKTFEERFWEKVEKTEGCWTWTGSFHGTGYGMFAIGDRRSDFSHRVSWRIHFGEIPAGIKVLHTCDNRPCVRPDHLFLGTQRENIADMDAKGRRSKGSSHTGAKLSEEDVVAIRASSESHAELGRRYGVASCHIYKIRKGETWRHLL